MDHELTLFVTYGSGLEPFVTNELKKCKVTPYETELQTYPGKHFFYCCRQEVIQSLRKELKTVERLFGVVFATVYSSQTSHCESRHELLNYLFHVSFRSGIKEKLELWRTLILNSNYNNLEGSHSEEEVYPPSIKRLRKSHDDSGQFGFRVNVKVTGSCRNFCDPRSASKSIGTAIVKNLRPNWRIELKRPDILLNVYVTDNGIIFAIPLTVKPLSEREYLIHIPLRATVAYSMGSLLFRYLESTNCDSLLVVDPMCGTGTILIELSLGFQDKCLQLIGMDIDESQLIRAQENVRHACVQDRVSLIQSNTTRPYGFSRQIDSIVCDLPFGQQHGHNEGDVKELLPLILTNMNNVLKSEGTSILLMSLSLSEDLKNAAKKMAWKLLEEFPLKLGELHAKIFVFQKS